MKNQKKRSRRADKAAIRIGIRLGLLVFTAIMTVKLCMIGIETLESRTGAPGGEIFILPLIFLLLWAGWTARKEYEELKQEGEQRHEQRTSKGIPQSIER